MEAVAFQSVVKDDVIHIPEQYKGIFSSPVLVTIIMDVQQETKEKTTTRKNTEWLKHPWKMDSFTPLTRDEIYDRS